MKDSLTDTVSRSLYVTDQHLTLTISSRIPYVTTLKLTNMIHLSPSHDSVTDAPVANVFRVRSSMLLLPQLHALLKRRQIANRRSPGPRIAEITARVFHQRAMRSGGLAVITRNRMA